MPKQSDIVGMIRVPEEAYGRFWNFCKTTPGVDFTPDMLAQAPADKPKRVNGSNKSGTSGRCLVLRALDEAPRTRAQLQTIITNTGKAPNTLHGLVHAMKKSEQVRQTADKLWHITAAGKKFLKEKCEVVA